VHGTDETHTKFWLEDLKGKGHLQDPGIDWKIILRWILRKQHMRVCIGFVWLRMGSHGRLL